MTATVTLKTGREKSVLQKHPWIFSQAIESFEPFVDGDICKITSSAGEHLGYGYCTRKSQIFTRMLSFDETAGDEALENNLKEAILLRRACSFENMCRLVHAEGDYLPGLIVDRYSDVLVVQIGTLGMEKVKERVVRLLKQEQDPSWIVEVSTSPSRKEEGLTSVKQTLWGTPVEEVEVLEGDLRFFVSPLKGQKTGFFLDLRAMRFLVQKMAFKKRVCNLCSYTGAFSCHALKGGASFCLSVDISQEAIDQTTRHIELNGFVKERHSEVVQDVFDFLHNERLDFDLVILDPPAFAKQKKDIPAAMKAYRSLNYLALKKMPKNSLFLTCSCSYHIDEALFRKLLFQAALRAGRKLQIIQTLRLSFDHPLSIYHLEGGYLKSFLCYVR